MQRETGAGSGGGRKPVKVLLPGQPAQAASRARRCATSPPMSRRRSTRGSGTTRSRRSARRVHHRMGLENNTRTDGARSLPTNVASERLPLLRVMPLFHQEFSHESWCSTRWASANPACAMSNLGRGGAAGGNGARTLRGWTSSSACQATRAAQLRCRHMERRRPILNCIRNIREPELELHFYRVLHRLGLPVKVESNQRRGERKEKRCIVSNAAWSWPTAKKDCPLCGTPVFHPDLPQAIRPSRPIRRGAAQPAGGRSTARGVLFVLTVRGALPAVAVHPCCATGA